jgi:hypothetical protein
MAGVGPAGGCGLRPTPGLVIRRTSG